MWFEQLDTRSAEVRLNPAVDADLSDLMCSSYHEITISLCGTSHSALSTYLNSLFVV